MKDKRLQNFFRTAYGKIILFFLSFLFLGIMAVSIFYTIWLYREDTYRKDEKYAISEGLFVLMDYKATTMIKETAHAPEDHYLMTDEYPNLIFEIYDENGELVGCSYHEGERAGGEMIFEYKYLVEFGKDRKDIINVYERNYTGKKSENSAYYTVFMGYRDDLYYNDLVKTIVREIRQRYKFRYTVPIISVYCFVVYLLLLAGLMTVCGRKPHTEDIYPGPFDKLPLECLILFIYMIRFTFVNLFWDQYQELLYQVLNYDVYKVVSVILCYPILLILLMALVRRFKAGTLWKNTLLYRFLVLGKRFLSLIPLVPFVAISMVLMGLFNGFMNWYLLKRWHVGILSALFFTELILFAICFLFMAGELKKIERAVTEISDGNLSYHVDEAFFLGPAKKTVRSLNDISSTIDHAVKERVKSEHMKTELITNVSHDIKTPVTSIINYADLLSKEPTDNEKIIEYCEVLKRQSGKLKALVEDLVEISKARSGNLDVVLERCDAGVFISQAAGEYEERLSTASLSLVISQPEEEVAIMADGRRMWRIFDNVMGNICKYAMEGSRVYLTLEKDKGQAVISFKNISREPLNISAEALMERFVRGDASRHTEGNGLGLSIAGSMAELQGGDFKLFIDGDLFKVILTFPLVK